MTSRPSEGFPYPEEHWAGLLYHSKIFPGNHLTPLAVTMFKPRTGALQRAEQGAQQAAAGGLELARRPAVWTGRTRVEQGGDVLLEEVSLEGAEEVCGRRQGHPEMLEALVVLVEGEDSGDGLCMTRSVTEDALQFDTPRRASPGSSGRERVHAMLPDFCGFPQHLPALKLYH